MNKEKDFFKTCFNTVAGLEVKNESQAIAKEVVLSEIENLQQENKKYKEAIDRAIQLLEDDNICADIRRMKPKCNENKYGVEYELLDILKEVSE